MTETITFHTSEGNDLKMTLYGRELPDDAPCIIYMHGFKGFKDWGFIPPTGEMLAQNGMRFLAMNYSHNGIGEDPFNFTELEKFKLNTFSLERSEAIQVIEAYQAGKLYGDTSKAKTGLIGHSRGGFGALLVGSHLDTLSAVCLWAPVSNQMRFDEKTIEYWKTHGSLEIKNSRTGQIMELGYQLHEDLIAHKDTTLNSEKAAWNIGKPLCVIHGTADQAVSVDDGKEIHSWAGKYSELHLIEEGQHTFGAKQPWVGSTPHLDEVWSHTLSFFQKHLND